MYSLIGANTSDLRKVNYMNSRPGDLNNVRRIIRMSLLRKEAWEYTTISFNPKRHGMSYFCRKCGAMAYSDVMAIDHNQVKRHDEIDDEDSMVDCPVPKIIQKRLENNKGAMV